MKRWLWLLPLLLAAVAYAPAPWGDLVWDDYFIEQQLPAFQSPGDLLFPPDGIRGWTYAYYRPVVVLSYMLDATLFGAGSTIGPHLSNLIFHVLTTWLVWLFAIRLLGNRPNGAIAAVVAAAIFAVHPIHTESVHWIAGRSDVLATMFVLPSIILALRWRDGGAIWTVFLAGFFYLLGLMSKEVAVAALLIVPATLFMVPLHSSGRSVRDSRLTWFVAAVVFLLATVLYFALRQDAVNSSGDELLGLSLGKSAWSLIRAGAYYLLKLVLPWPQSNIVVWEMLPGFAAATLILLFGLAVVALAIGWWRKQGDGVPLLALFWIAIGIAPSLVIAIGDVSLGGSVAAAGKFPVAERYLYLPSVGLALFLGAFCCAVLATRWRKQAGWVMTLLIVVYAGATLNRGFTWNNNLRLWSDTTAKVKTHGSPWNELGRAYLALDDDENALRSFKRALGLNNTSTDRATMSHNIGTIYLRRQDLGQAENYFRLALDVMPTLAEPHYGMGLVYTVRIGSIYRDGGSTELLEKHVTNATRHFTTATRINPDFHLARLLTARVQADYGQALERQGNLHGALAAYRLALAQIDATMERIPPAELGRYQQQWQGQVNVDLATLRSRLDDGLQRLEP
jgi:tetratricopeptide (TPR) repeat protein